MRTETKVILMIVVFLLIFSYGVYNLFQPERFPISFIRGEVIQYNDRLLFGPYPSKKEILKLKRMGVKVIVNLMSPTFPVEAPLIYEENQICQKQELTCINFPLSFLKLDSQSNRSQVMEVVQYILSNPDKTYVHCYLGRHRTALVMDQIEKAFAATPSLPDAQP